MSILARHTPTSVRPRLNRRVLIVTDDVDGSIALVEHLKALSLDVSLTGYDGSDTIELPERAPSAVLCFLSDYVEQGPKIVALVRQRYAPREFPILGRLMRETEGDSPYDSVLYEPVHAVQVAHRVSSLIRLGQMEAEIVRRMETLRDTFGQDITLPDAPLRQPFRVLFIGKADPAYMAVVNSLQDKNVNVVAAFTSFSAFDYLHDSTFDAVVMNALQGGEPALTIAETMRRNPRLFHVPTLLLVDKKTFRETDTAYANGIKDLIDADAPPEELSGRVLELANDCRLHQQLKDEFTNLGGPDCSDPETGVLNARFLHAHLKRVSRDCRARKVPLSILTIKLTPKFTSALTGDALKLAYAQSIKMIAGVVRMQDIVARIDKDKVVVAFPEEHRTDVARVAARINDMIETATFPDSDGTPDVLRMKVETAIVEQSEELGTVAALRSDDHLELVH
ncbi:GGDEF domain-containing protein [Algimonas arctica]|uniref:GGDEF domain-containing protein n=1 Tax=Algimonas arctica TaxID=1479486 RepID=A0A8J3G161_9PROT|nr:diguanylate cyclase [Algimonas arctica]GHA83957.1 GGDEF domain-containing protein [Algimonas arctica]